MPREVLFFSVRQPVWGIRHNSKGCTCSTMEFQAVLLVFTLLAWQSFAQYPSYNAGILHLLSIPPTIQVFHIHCVSLQQCRYFTFVQNPPYNAGISNLLSISPTLHNIYIYMLDIPRTVQVFYICSASLVHCKYYTLVWSHTLVTVHLLIVSFVQCKYGTPIQYNTSVDQRIALDNSYLLVVGIAPRVQTLYTGEIFLVQSRYCTLVQYFSYDPYTVRRCNILRTIQILYTDAIFLVQSRYCTLVQYSS